MYRLIAIFFLFFSPVLAQAWDGSWLNKLAPFYPDSKMDSVQLTAQNIARTY